MSNLIIIDMPIMKKKLISQAWKWGIVTYTSLQSSQANTCSCILYNSLQLCLYCDQYSIGSMYAHETDLDEYSIGDQSRGINRCGNRRNTKQVTEQHTWNSRWPTAQ